MNLTKRFLLIEYVPLLLNSGELEESVGEFLWLNHRKQVSVEFPSPKTNCQWQLTSEGWVGYIPVNPEVAFVLLPKVPLENLFRMLEYAYRLKSLFFGHGLMDCRSLEEFYERLAHVLALRILERGRKGYYHSYASKSERLPYISGKLNTSSLVSAPWNMTFHCEYVEHTADIEDNQILTWTLFTIIHSGQCSPQILQTVRKAYNSLQCRTNLIPFRSKECIGRQYHRLNLDYHPMHALCRFFLSHTGPTHEIGQHAMLPFLVNMASLFQLFIAEWLKAHLPEGYKLQDQERVYISQQGGVYFTIDLVLYDVESDKPLLVLDTKYKTSIKPKPEDMSQIVAYAVAKGCKEAILIYPTDNIEAMDIFIGDIRVRNLAFSLDGDIELAGIGFLQNLLLSHSP